MLPAAAIDLDADRHGPAPRPSRRRWVCGLLLAGLLPLLGASGPARSPDPVVVLHGEGITAIAGDGSAMYVLSNSALVSYRTQDGVRRWTAPVTPGAQLLGVDDTRVVVGVDDPPAVLGLDAATGTEVWRQTGYVPALYGCACAAGIVVAQRYRPEQQPPFLAGLDRRTGAVRWSIATPPESRRRFTLTRPDRVEILVLSSDGTLRVYSAETGEAVQTMHLEPPPGPQVAGLARNGNRLLTYESGLGSMLNGRIFDLPTGRLLWQRTTAPGGETLWWCGRSLCAQEQEGPIAVLDPGTGASQWRLDGRETISGVSDQYLLATPPPPSVDSLILDATSGRAVRRLDGWQPVGIPSGTRLLVSRNDGAVTLVAHLDLKTGNVTVLGRSAGRAVPQACIVTSTLLACRTDQDRVPIWRVEM